MKKIAVCILLAGMMSSCGLYVMPTEDDMTTTPTVNNPHIINDKSSGSFMPSIDL